MTDATGSEKVFTCPYCDAEYRTKQGLARHLKRCDATPDSDEEPAPGGGIPLYAEPAPKPEPAHMQDEDDDCICPECGYTAKYECPVCPKCGVELEWD